MSQNTPPAAGLPPVPTKRKRPWTWERAFPFLTVLPSFVAIVVFVYGFIAWTGWISLTKWNTLTPNMAFVGLKNYARLFTEFRFQADLRNLLFFTLLFILLCLVIGLLLAVMVDRKIRAEGFFRNIFIFPMALSFIVTGVVWQWLLSPRSGFNLILKALGWNPNHLPGWYTSTNIIPSIHWGQIQFGIPVALVAVVIAAVWQMSGFAMALYLAGLRAIPDEIHEAARVDGASEWKSFWKVTFPQLRPITATTIIILAHISMKIFDLIYAMTGPGAEFVTDMPSVNMFNTTFQGQHYAEGAAIAIFMLLALAVFIVPYMVTSLRKEGD
ncbi:sugar ABC transporter permease [Alicyclobacillus contaminans]|nr:sugar ABC transporter permease [Alicyclobacillus contaminans]